MRGVLLSGAAAMTMMALTPSSAYAQSEEEQAGLEEIVVTARKREESLQDTPISITAFTASALEDRGIGDIEQIGEFTPNLVFDRAASIGGSGSTAVIYIRGLGQDSGLPTIDQAVGLYVDGVYMARAVGSVVDLVDIERVEVLRGPQGTLFGRNTIGGAISITTQRPDQDFHGYVVGSVGDDERRDVRVSFNAPITSELAASFTVSSNQRDGYVIRADGADMGDTDATAARVAALWTPSNDFDLYFAADYSRRRENGAPFVLNEVTLLGTNGPTFGMFHNAFVAPVGVCAPPFDLTLTDPNCYSNQWIAASGETDFGTLPARDDLDLWGASLSAEWRLGNITLRSITSYRDTESAFSLDQDHSPLTIAHVVTDFEHNQFTQELQLLGEAFGGRLNYIVGAYYFQEEGALFERVTFAPVDFISGGSVDNDSLAFFTQATLDITDRLSLTAGVRYTEDTKRFTPDTYVVSSGIGIPPGTPILPSDEAVVEVEEITPMVNLAYDWSQDFMTYITYSEGFRGGGFTQRVFPPNSTVPSFDPEFVEVWEAGFKWVALDNRLRLNAAVFDNQYSDLQFVTQDTTVGPTVRNAGAAEVRGGELELTWLATEALQFDVGVGYLDAQVTEVDPATLVSPGASLVRAPEWSTSAGVSYEFNLGELGTLTPRLDWVYRSDTYYEARNRPQSLQPSYDLINVGLTYESVSGDWAASLIGKNLTDERVLQSVYTDQRDLGLTEAMYGRGEEWILTLRRSF
jgi:iron complex outermembrane receptor protein